MRVPVRTCVACRRSAGKRELIRLVVARGAVQVDPGALRPGRGAYLCALAGCVDAALRRDGAAIRRALRLGQAPRQGQALQQDRGHVTLDVGALRAQLGEVEGTQTERSEDTQTERSDARGKRKEAALLARGTPPSPLATRE